MHGACRGIAALALAGAMMIGCDDGTAPGVGSETKPSTPAETPRATATLRGVVRFRGTPPARTFHPLPSHPEFAGTSQGPVAEQREVNDDGTLPWVFVYATAGPSLALGDVAPPPAVIELRGNALVPHVLGMVAGEPLLITNRQDMLFNAHVRGRRLTQEWNRSLPTAGTSGTFVPAAEFGVRVTCDVHPWMLTWLHVLEHPFFAVSERGTGRYEIAGLAPGPHIFRTWHETWAKTKAEQVEFTVDLQPGANVRDLEIRE